MTAFKVGQDTVIDSSSAFTGRYSTGMAPRMSNLSILSSTDRTIPLTSTGRLSRRMVKLSTSTILFCGSSSSTFHASASFIDGSYNVTNSAVFTIESVGVLSDTISIKRLSNTSALLAYALSASPFTIKMVVLSISGGVISAGTPVTVESPTSADSRISLAKTDSAADPTKFIFVYSFKNASSLSELSARSLTVSGTTITLNAVTSLGTLTNTIGVQCPVIADHDTDQILRFPVITTIPNAITGTWSRDVTGKVTLTSTEIFNNIAASSNATCVHRIDFAGGSPDPASGEIYIISTTGNNTAVIYTMETAVSSGTFTLYNCSYFATSFSVTGSTLGIPTIAGRVTMGHASPSGSNDTMQLIRVSQLPYITNSNALGDIHGNYLFAFRFNTGVYKLHANTNSVYACRIFSSGAAYYNNLSGNHQFISNGISDISEYDKDKQIAIGFFQSSLQGSIFACRVKATGNVFNMLKTSQIDTYNQINSDITKDLLPGYTTYYGYGDAFAVNPEMLTDVVELPILNRTNQQAGAIYRLQDPKRFAFFYFPTSSIIRTVIIDADL